VTDPRTASALAWADVRPRLTEEALAVLGADEADAFLARAELALPEVHEPLAELYGGDVDALFERALRIALDAAA
jgi:amylosucrase